MQLARTLACPFTDRQMQDASERLKHPTLGNIYVYLSSTRRVESMDAKSAYAFEYEGKKGIILGALRLNFKVSLLTPGPQSELHKKLIVDLSINHQLSAAQISQYINISSVKAQALIDAELKGISELNGMKGIVEKQEDPAPEYLNKDGSTDALKFAYWLYNKNEG